ncbi:kinase-like domain-containing protein [Aspergillus stella-maris]|uniref:kinase-like domain-containing protein n=1 Tax=Aspergillus stella-maris TaxID=1810926 RepID=UPI003CCD2D25
MLPASIAQSLERTDLSELELAGVGCFAQVFKVADTGLVIKPTFDHPVVGDLQQSEKRIYERLGSHPYILRYYGEYCGGGGLSSGLVFEHHPAGTLADSLDLSKYPNQRSQWSVQAAEALRYIHSKNVIHSDFGSHNFLVQQNGSLVLADFGGSIIDDDMAVVSYSTRYARPDCDPDISTEVDDVFALDTVLYEITTGHLLYPDHPSKEMRFLLKQRRFSDLGDVPQTLRVVI